MMIRGILLTAMLFASAMPADVAVPPSQTQKRIVELKSQISTLKKQPDSKANREKIAKLEKQLHGKHGAFRKEVAGKEKLQAKIDRKNKKLHDPVWTKNNPQKAEKMQKRKLVLQAKKAQASKRIQSNIEQENTMVAL